MGGLYHMIFFGGFFCALAVGCTRAFVCSCSCQALSGTVEWCLRKLSGWMRCWLVVCGCFLGCSSVVRVGGCFVGKFMVFLFDSMAIYININVDIFLH